MGNDGSIHKMRMGMGISHKRLSELSGVDVSTIRKIEYGWVYDHETYLILYNTLNSLKKGNEDEKD